MRTSLPRRVFVLLPFACVALYGCPQEDTTPDPGEYADVIYGGAATDEAMVALGSALEKGPPIEDPARAPVLDTPTATPLPGGTVPDFTWHFGSAASRRDLSAPTAADRALARDERRWSPREFGSPALPDLLRSSSALTRPAPGWLAPVADLFGPVRAARAHGDPLNGTATFLVFSTKSDPALVRVFTDQSSFTPGQTVWDDLAAAGEEITLSLVAAEFDQNRIAEGGEPVQGTRFTFTITP